MADCNKCNCVYRFTFDRYVFMNIQTEIKCLNPRFIQNKYTGKEILVECGKCEHCLMKKSVVRTQLCKMESALHKFHYFVTLTFSNEHLPKARLILQNDLTDNYDLVRESDGLVLGNVTFRRYVDKVALCKKCGTTINTIPILDYSYCQLFLKRLRKYISKYSNENIRFFACGEYGPVHFRPHFHLSLWFDEEKTSSCIQQAIFASWPFGRVDSSLSAGQSSSYVASYINSCQHLPRVFKFPGTAPFARHSLFLGVKFFESEIQKVQELEYSSINRKRICVNGFNTDVFLWRSLKTRLFPKCKGYASLPQHERVLSYSSYAIVRDWAQETCPIYLARFLTDYIKYEDFYHPDNRINDLLQLIRFHLNYYDCHGHYITPFLSDYEKLERSIYMMLLLSKRFLSYHCLGNDSYNNVLKMVIHIDKFYKEQDYDNLKHQLQQQEDTKKNGIHHHYVYHNAVDLQEYLESSVYHSHSSSMKKRFSTFVKHKKLNDLNKFFNY